jgi:ketosteroid isomerase-like protein
MAEASVQDWFAINNLFIRYATSLDKGDIDGVISCFTEDGTIDSPIFGAYAGHEGIREFAERTATALQVRGIQFRHIVSNLVIDVEGNAATATCYLLDFATREGNTELLSPGRCNCNLRKIGDVWQISSRTVTMDRVSPADMR